MTPKDWLSLAVNAAILVGGLMLFNWRLTTLEVKMEQFARDYVRTETMVEIRKNISQEIQLEIEHHDISAR